MKNVANCDKYCDLQNSWVIEFLNASGTRGKSCEYVCLSVRTKTKNLHCAKSFGEVLTLPVLGVPLSASALGGHLKNRADCGFVNGVVVKEWCVVALCEEGACLWVGLSFRVLLLLLNLLWNLRRKHVRRWWWHERIRWKITRTRIAIVTRYPEWWLLLNCEQSALATKFLQTQCSHWGL